jgi:glycerol-3-phosphate acyltransferase PlsY
VYLRFKGGKGIATSAGALLGVVPLAVGIGFAVWLAAFLLTRYVSVASIVTAIALVATGWLLYRPHGLAVPVALTLLGGLGVWRHKSNIQRLLNGTENRFSFGSGKREDACRDSA